MESDAAASPVRDFTTAIARGNNDAWMQFHREFGPRIFRHLLALTRGDHDLANEAFQQTYLRVARHARPCDSEPMFTGWLRVVARTALSDCRRRRLTFWQLLSRRAADSAAAEPIEQIAEDRLQSSLDDALALLDPDDRALLEAKYFFGVHVKEIAETLAISPKAAESRLTRARATLKQHLLATLARHE